MTKTTLAVSQCFLGAYPKVRDRIGALTVNNMAKAEGLPAMHGLDLTAHLDGFIDDAFDRMCTPDFYESLRRHDVKLASFDLGPACRKVRMDECYVPDSPVLDPDEIIADGKARMKTLRANYKGLVALENLDYHPGGAYDHICEPAFINRALKDWDAGITLDIGHLSVTCHHTMMDPFEFIRQIDSERILELHVSHANGGEDSHGLPDERDYKLVEFALSRSKPLYVKLEYYWEPEPIIEHTLRLCDLVDAARLKVGR